MSPVLTAHPTEVQRKSTLDAERDIAELLAARENLRTPRERAENEARLRARIAQLWQTRMLRAEKLTVRDEIENALSYYTSTFLTEIPRLYADLEEQLGRPVALVLPDGQLDRRRPRRQSERRCRHAGHGGAGGMPRRCCATI